VLKGRGQFAAEWMLVAQKTSTNARWVLAANKCLYQSLQQGRNLELQNKEILGLERLVYKEKGVMAEEKQLKCYSLK
jgi:hypothetical protein